MDNFLSPHDFLKTAHISGPTQKPTTIAEAGVRDSLLEALALKALYLSGPFSVLDLAEHTRLGFDIANELFHRLRAKMLCEVTGMSVNVPDLAITSQGRARALEMLSQSQYSGPAPVSLESYVDQVRKQRVTDAEVHYPEVARGFSHLVIDPKTLAQFGTALNSGEAIFLYGPPGVGKTAVAETLSRVLAEDDVWIPYAVEVEGQIITIYDPVIHRRMKELEPDTRDERWVRCRRPAVMVGGELTIDMLDLQFNPATNYYVGPVQMKANNGVLIIDDFGRQRIHPEDLLNRWVVPLDRRIEFLTLAGGRKIEIPFEMLVVFASNLDPATMLDPAFLRRIQTKIYLGAATEEQFAQIFYRVAEKHGLAVDRSALVELIHIIRDTLKQDLRGCVPRDLINQVLWSAKYQGSRPELSLPALMQAVEAYFLPKA
ncbi:MAG TPA: hypothetical protein VFI20_10005 [Terracidiphilus sp.]|nr:hypothetical protein [Terracidiphilus sp.]